MFFSFVPDPVNRKGVLRAEEPLLHGAQRLQLRQNKRSSMDDAFVAIAIQLSCIILHCLVEGQRNAESQDLRSTLTAQVVCLFGCVSVAGSGALMMHV